MDGRTARSQMAYGRARASKRAIEQAQAVLAAAVRRRTTDLSAALVFFLPFTAALRGGGDGCSARSTSPSVGTKSGTFSGSAILSGDAAEAAAGGSAAAASCPPLPLWLGGRFAVPGLKLLPQIEFRQLTAGSFTSTATVNGQVVLEDIQ